LIDGPSGQTLVPWVVIVAVAAAVAVILDKWMGEELQLT
jgi:hypothetical protein